LASTWGPPEIEIYAAGVKRPAKDQWFWKQVRTMTARTEKRQRNQRMKFVTKYIPDEFQVKSYYSSEPLAKHEVSASLTKTQLVPEGDQFVSIPISTCRERCTEFATRISHRKLCSSKYLFPADISDSNRE
jgi:hypothetical protein